MGTQFSSVSGAALRGHDQIVTIVTKSEKAHAIIINIPGLKGDIHGYNNKYQKIGTMLAARGTGAFVQMPNRMRDKEDFATAVDDLASVIQSTLREAREMCATAHPDLYLMGVSAGGAAVAAVAGRFAQVKKILLIAPALYEDHPFYEMVAQSVKNYAGEIWIAVGEKDEVTGPSAAYKYYKLALNAKRREFELIQHCDHQFTGTENGQILSKAPLWAFAGETTFPSPEGGLELY